MNRIRSLVVATACASFVSTTACDKAKDALKDALGIDQLKQEEIDALLQQTGWNLDDPRLKGFKILGGIKITDKFKGDLGQEVEVPVPPLDGAAQAEGKTPSISLLKAITFTLNDKEYKRFQIVSVGSYDAAKSALTIDGGMVNQFLDADQQLNKNNQASDGGTYLLMKGTTGGLAYLKGTTKIKTAAGGDANVGDALVFTSASPFVARSGNTTGQYFLAMLEGEKGTVTGYKKGLGSGDFLGTPESASTDIPYAGLLDNFPELGEKAEMAESKGAKNATEYLAQANAKVTDLGAKYGYGWKLVDANLLWTQPPQKEPVQVPAPIIPPVNPPPTPPPGEEPVESTQPSTPPPEPTGNASQGILRSVAETDPQVDLGCNGVLANGESSFVYDGSKFADDTVKGWRFQGDVRATSQGFLEIFKAPADLAASSQGRYLDVYASACVLTTGDQLYQASEQQEKIYQPGPGDEGRTSEMWQKVKVPAEARSIQVRVAFLSQEYPRFVGTQFNDSFFIKFDESLNYIAAGNLNDIAGEGEEGIDLSSCRSQAPGALQSCGDWKPITASDTPAAGALASGSLFDIAKSTQAQTKGQEFRSMTSAQVAANGSERAYYGMVEPKIICRDLDATSEIGQTLTLRFNVTDAGDNLFDSALAVDSVVFSTKPCNPTDTFTGEQPSRANVL